jgi:ribosomal-protein-alanine N-acetyltransferase
MSAVIEQSFDGIRPMQETDLDEVYAIEESVYPYPWTRGIFNDCLLVGYSCWVYEQQGKVIAYVVMSVAAGEAHILTLAVHPDSQGKGYAKQILNYALEIARERGADSVYLEVRPTNDRAISIYQKAGFNEIGIRKNYYPAEDGREDALVMALSFID